jgi:site-specific DNA-methyltransferase (adenine-specific)
MNEPTIIGKATLYNMDCMELLKATPDKFYDLAIVDPPYGIGMGGGKVGNIKVAYKQFAGADKAVPEDEYFYELQRASKNMIIWGGNYFNLPPTPCFICWDKVQPENFTMAMCEFAWASFKSPAKIYKQRIVGADIERIHPTQKPVALYEWLLTNYAKQGDKILDTHLGSGSHAIACNNLGFELTACELDKDYFDASVKRITQANKQIRMFA